MFETFWIHVDIRSPKECWPWKGPSFTRRGYGIYNYNRLSVRKKSYRAHRVAFYLTYGRWPKPQCRHTCDNRPCCNPKHLLEGTHLDNVRDALERNRYRGRPGELHHAAKLTSKEVEEIIALAKTQLSQKQIGVIYGVSQQQISRIILGIRWSKGVGTNSPRLPKGS